MWNTICSIRKNGQFQVGIDGCSPIEIGFKIFLHFLSRFCHGLTRDTNTYVDQMIFDHSA